MLCAYACVCVVPVTWVLLRSSVCTWVIGIALFKLVVSLVTCERCFGRTYQICHLLRNATLESTDSLRIIYEGHIRKYFSTAHAFNNCIPHLTARAAVHTIKARIIPRPIFRSGHHFVVVRLGMRPPRPTEPACSMSRYVNRFGVIPKNSQGNGG